MNRPYAFLLAVALVLAPATGAFAQNDVVVQKNNQQMEGTILKDDATGVRMRLQRGGEVDIAINDILEIRYGNTPNAYNLGLAAYRNGDFESAISGFDSALGFRPAELLKQYIHYYKADSLRKLGDTEEAVKAFEAVYAMGAATRFRIDAARNLAELYFASNDLDKVKSLLGDLGEGRTNPERLSIRMLQASVLERQGDFNGAMRAYNQASGFAGREADKVAAAKIGAARCMVGLRQYAQAEREAQEVISAGSAGELYPDAYMVLGDAIIAQAQDDARRYRAILSYLRVPALYSGNPNEARALRDAALAFRKITGDAKAAERADALLKMLRQRHPNSPYAR